jgi:hypothetical protein
MISTLYTLDAQLRSFDSDGTFCSTSSYFTAKQNREGEGREGGSENEQQN